jgi:hypothetical protein
VAKSAHTEIGNWFWHGFVTEVFWWKSPGFNFGTAQQNENGLGAA